MTTCHSAGMLGAQQSVTCNLVESLSEDRVSWGLAALTLEEGHSTRRMSAHGPRTGCWVGVGVGHLATWFS